ncbi:putative membrane protein [Synechococcus sp. PROS-U-1]|nr:putative membrane protein [Synechococcus sp. PROS-U-1]
MAEMLLPVPTEHVLVVITVVVAAFVIDAESGSLMPKTRG